MSSDAVLRLFADGSTVVLQGLHRLWPPLIEFADQLAADLGPPDPGQRLRHPAVLARVQPALRRPRRLRAAGGRREALAHPRAGARRPAARPSRGTTAPPRSPRPPSGSRSIDAVLRPGDALYLPRGFLHSAAALGEISAHLTVGVHPVTRWARRRVGAGPGAHARRRRPAAARLAPARPGPGRPRRRAGRRGRRDRRPAGLARPARSRRGGRPAARRGPGRRCGPSRWRRWPSPPRRRRSTDETVLRAAPPAALRAPRRPPTAGHAARRTAHRTPSPPRRARALAALLAAGELKVGDLPGLDAADRLALARRLVTESIATVPDARQSPARDAPSPPASAGSTPPLLGAGAGPRRLPRRHRVPGTALAADRAARPVGPRRARRVAVRPGPSRPQLARRSRAEGVRLLLVRRPGERLADSGRRWAYADSRPGQRGAVVVGALVGRRPAHAPWDGSVGEPRRPARSTWSARTAATTPAAPCAGARWPARCRRRGRPTSGSAATSAATGSPPTSSSCRTASTTGRCPATARSWCAAHEHGQVALPWLRGRAGRAAAGAGGAARRPRGARAARRRRPAGDGGPAADRRRRGGRALGGGPGRPGRRRWWPRWRAGRPRRRAADLPRPCTRRTPAPGT